MGFILHPKRTFPDTVLLLSAEERVEFFKTSGMVFHPRLKSAFEELKLKVSSKGCTSLVALVGATGSGKSVALNRLAKYVLEAKDQEMNENPYIKPVIYVEAPPGSRGYYPWKELYRRKRLNRGQTPPICRDRILTDWPRIFLSKFVVTDPGFPGQDGG